MTTRKQVTIFLGPPGCGKGSLSQLCSQKLNWVQLSTGSLCRKHIIEQTDIGKQIDFSIKSGKLIDDKLIVTMVEQWLKESIAQNDGIILDGFPRNVAQAESLRGIIKNSLPHYQLNVVKLFASDEVILQRVLGRSICENKDCQAIYSLEPGSALLPKKPGICDVCSSKLIRRTDDTAETLRDRLHVYYGFEQNILDFYANDGLKIHEINVEKPLDKIFVEFSKVIN